METKQQKFKKMLPAYQRIGQTISADHKYIYESQLDFLEQKCLSNKYINTHIDLEKSTPDKYVFNIKYYHYDESDVYRETTSHVVEITPSLRNGFYLKGLEENSVIRDIFDELLRQEVPDWVMDEKE